MLLYLSFHLRIKEDGEVHEQLNPIPGKVCVVFVLQVNFQVDQRVAFEVARCASKNIPVVPESFEA